MMQVVLMKFFKEIGPETLGKKFAKATPAIVARMKAQHLTPETTVLEVLVRDALFRLWRSVIPSGDIADLIRDHQTPGVLQRVRGTLTATESLDLTAIVKATAAASVDLTF